MSFFIGMLVSLTLGVGFLGIVILQSIDNLKKSLDSKNFDSEVLRTELEFYKEKYKDLSTRTEAWSEFTTEPQPTQPEKNSSGKYNPEEVKGLFDEMFVEGK